MADKPKRRKGFKKEKKSRLGLWVILLMILLMAGYLQALEAQRPHVSGDRLRFDTVVDLAETDRISTARILNFDAYVVGKYLRDDGSKATYFAPYLKVAGSQERLIDLLLDNRIPTTIDQQNAKLAIGPLLVAIPALMLVLVFGYFILSWQRGTGLFSIGSGAQRIEPEEATARFTDVAGQDAAVTEVKEIAMFLSNPERFTQVGAQIPKGLLLYGPPGCGKTLLARALAGEAGASFYSISGSDFVELFVGVGASRVRDLFKQARENAPAIIFIDELDSIGRRRAGGASQAATGTREEQEQALNQILAEMDGFSPSQGIIVIGATNRPDILDPALLRPGRFDRNVGLERPDEAGRRAILAVHAREKPLAQDVDLDDIAKRAVGMTGADLASVINEAALLAARAGKTMISKTEVDRALVRILEAPERQRRLSMRDRTMGSQSTTEDRVTFDDVAGVEEAIEELAEVRDYLDDPDRFVSLGARTPRGYLLVGPPGCGKTLLARAVATESNSAFFSVAASEFTEVFVGEGAGRVRDLFAQARAVAPAIIFIDEIDAIGAERQVSLSGHRETEQTLNQILIELDGFGNRTGVIVMAASNRPEILDPALVRPGRFDRTITLGLPDRAGRRAILEVHAAGKPLGPDVDLDVVAGLTQGLSGADLANVMNEAALLAARRRQRDVSAALIDESLERVSMGISRAHVLDPDERRVVAYHEAGHALVAWQVDQKQVPHKISIIPRGQSLGSVRYGESDDRVIHSRSQLLDNMAIALGGRIAEELIFGEPGSGAADDLVRVTRVARMMVCELGMSKAMGARVYSASVSAGNGAGINGSLRPYSDGTAGRIDQEIDSLVEEAHDRARSILRRSKRYLEKVAQLLLEKETLTAAEFADALGKTDPAQV
ncbi:MAG TPA: AAA family ATPase [Actinomycetota bacterium]|nr:AAA family ATPase [Actinomycetota bacterium]